MAYDHYFHGKENRVWKEYERRRKEVKRKVRKRTYYKDSSRFFSRSDNNAFPGTPFRPRPRSHFRVDRL
ncbi:hypothetical protein E2C01_083923 [Portunus trituberculatus]|uniref:Uncharacterized protein n=1 Tax=Portunus trituberculatus TaxID=210409 RepID=A0A5B7J2M7_PORTR|nr:hypothetical protein [Portunus trituberculatus]